MDTGVWGVPKLGILPWEPHKKNYNVLEFMLGGTLFGGLLGSGFRGS